MSSALKLHPVRNPPPRSRRVTWCGPAALSIITGLDYETCRSALTRIGNRTIKGSYNHEMVAALRFFGYTIEQDDYPSRPTLAAWTRRRKGDDATAMFLVNITRHYVVVQGRKACDNVTRTPVFLKDMRLRRSRVERVWKVTRLGP
jgi:hypothetical protein